MDYTIHAKKRAQQRCISPEMIEMMKLYGEVGEQKGDADVLYLNRKDIKRFLRDMQFIASKLNRKSRASAVIKDDLVITVFHQTKKIHTF
ncbi:DUF4258 domain-containing protein [Photobacterium marinum]|uniref:DUF4258 domain-containing protein n=1 Tax=Photobacterium marinum TaxID=1056511 RepID=UPI0005630C5D|nr:DUF4258 domain-containing protein [Photobacterium marinum]